MIHYLSPDYATVNRLMKIDTEINAVDFEASVTAITNEDSSMFWLFIDDYNWSDEKGLSNPTPMLQVCNANALQLMRMLQFR